MKNLIVIFILFPFFVKSQNNAQFSTDPNQFAKDVVAFMNINGLPDCKIATEAFQKVLKEGKITEDQLKYMAATANVMRERNMPASPPFVNYINAVVAFANSGKPATLFNDWDDVCDQMLRNLKRGENREFTSYLEFSKFYFESNALHISQAKTWKVDATDCKLEYIDGKPRLKIPPTRFYGFISSDTIQVYNTSGYYYPVENKFEGKNGRTDWKRSSQDVNKVFCQLKNYTVNLASFGFTADSVTFTNTNYLKKTLQGKYIDKLIFNNDSSASQYPKFESYDNNIVLNQVAPNVDYFGGFNFWGTKVVGFSSNGESAGFNFFSRDGKRVVMRAYSKDILIIRDKELGATKAEMVIYFGKDSVYHPSVNLNYRVDTREVKVLRGETAIGRSRFIDSYHQYEFETDAILWNLDSSRLQFKILSGVGVNPANYESTNYFNKDRIRQMQGVANYEPLSILRVLKNQTGTDEVSAEAYAKKIDPKLTEVQIRSLLYKLVEQGFIIYEQETGMIKVREKTDMYVLANAKKTDYDIIRMRSVSPGGIDFLDINNADMELKGVSLIPISDTANVMFFPRKKSVKLQKNRDLLLDGTIIAGRIDISGENHAFEYDTFKVTLPKVDSLMMFVPDGDKLDEEGKPLLKPLRSKLENLKGLLEVDAPINKSGRSRLHQFPRITTKSSSFVYYEDSTENKGAYSKKDFFFEVEPFQIDSLNNLEPTVLDFKGKLVSGGIFPDISEDLKLQDDMSLGFKTEAPKEGLALFKDKGNYKGAINLDYGGLKGDGVITHSTAAFTSSNIRFYPDSVLAKTDSFTIAATKTGVMTPDVQSVGVDIFWKSKADSMYARMTETPFAMYGKSTQLKGNLLLTNKGLFGDGTLDWNEANLISNQFYFKTEDLGADTSLLRIKTPDGAETAFLSENVKSKVDFAKREGNFSNNLKGVPTEFAYNQYNTLIPDFRWDIDKHILEFKAPQGSNGEYFTSLNKGQKGLRFIAKRATYDLLNSILQVEQIPEIIVADSRIIPDSGKVVIEAEAKMRTLHNATIISDTISGTHKITKATLDIISKAELRGSGEYKYQALNTPEQTIVFDDISVKKTVVGERRNKEEEYHLSSKGPIDENLKFVLYPNVTFSGEASMYSQNPFMIFKGVSKITYQNSSVEPSEFSFEDTINPKQLKIHYKAESKDATGTPVVAGISCAKTAEEIHLYSNLLSVKENLTDPVILRADGIVFHDAKKNEYSFGDEKKILDMNPKGNVLRYNDATGVIYGEGEFTPGLDYGTLGFRMVGDVENNLEKGTFLFNTTLGIDVRTNKELDEKLAQIMYADNIDNNDVSYEGDRFKKQLAQLCDDKKDDAIMKEYDKVGIFKRPKEFIHNLVFTGVNFVFDREDGTLRSTGKFGLSYVGAKEIHKKVDGFIELGYRQGSDYMNVHIRTGASEWFYFEYTRGVLGILSSYDVFATQIGALMPSGKNVIKGENGKFYRYVIGSAANRQDFLDRMREKQIAAGEKPDEAPRPKPKPKPVDPQVPQGDGEEKQTPATASPTPGNGVDGAAEPATPKPAGRRKKYTNEIKTEETPAPQEQAPSTEQQPVQNDANPADAPAQEKIQEERPKKPAGRRQKYTNEVKEESAAPAESQPEAEQPKTEEKQTEPKVETQPQENAPAATDGVTTEDVPEKTKKKKKKSKEEEVTEPE